MRYGKILRNSLVVMAAAGVLGVAGCMTSGSARTERRGMNYRPDAQALVYDNQLKIVERTTAKVDGLLDVKLVAQNLTTSAVSLEYRFIWRNKAGVVTETPTSSWLPVTIPAGGKLALPGRALTPDAEDFLLSLRQAE